MKNFTDFPIGVLRMATGVLVLLIGLQPLSMNSKNMFDSIFPIHLPQTGILSMDVMVRLLFISFGLSLVLGIRTRLLAAFMLATTLFESIQCIQGNPTWTIGHIMLVLMLVGLSVLIIVGGGRYSLRRGGWANIPL